MMMRLNFTPLDSWFFKESRPMESMGNNNMVSVFPPTPYTMSGAVRSLIGESARINWLAYRAGDGTQHKQGSLDFCTLMGDPRKSGDLGKLRLQGTFIAKENHTLFPTPLDIVKTRKSENLQRLRPSKTLFQTDIGYTKLPELPGHISVQPVECPWISLKGLCDYLSGKVPQKRDLYKLSDLLTLDPRLGIAIDVHSRIVKTSQLYQTTHIRLSPDISLHQYIEGIDSQYFPNDISNIRLGAEGRLASVESSSASLELPAPKINTKQLKKTGLIIYFLTHANFNGSWLPETFQETFTAQGQTCWKGMINSIKVTIEACVIGKAIQEGGWDIAKHQPKPSSQMVPAGSLWYVQTDAPLRQAIQAIHLTQVGNETELGRGLIACGLWNLT